MSERLLALVIGLIAALLLSCACGALFLVTAGGSGETVASAAPADWSIQADIGERYLNRIFLDNLGTYPSPWPVTDGTLDVQPGNRIAFTATVQSPLGEMTAIGAVTITVGDGELAIRIADVSLGQVPVTLMLRLFQPGLEAQINAEANRQLLERAGQARLALAGITTDDAALHAYLVAIP